MERTHITREDVPEISIGDDVSVEVQDSEFEGTVRETSENGASNAYTIQINGTESKMYADVRSVELIHENESYFVSAVAVV